jgi:general secretion pathway protein I
MAKSSPAASTAVAADRRPVRRRARGFTLLEVLIGLVVLSLALLALTRTAALQVDSLGQLRDRTMAGWLAQDLLAETRIGNPFPPVGTSSGTRRFGPSEWRWEVNVQPTQVATIRRIDVRVFAGADRATPLAQLSGLAGQDLLP